VATRRPWCVSFQEAIAAAGARLLYLPPYWPDSSPSESSWSKLKAKLRKAKARTRRALDKALNQAIEHITGSDAKGWFKLCGYALH
jgi:transposase